MIDYDYAANIHSLEGPRSILNTLLPRLKPGSILDVGCGRGAWIKAAQDLGVTETLGIDGVAPPPEQLLFPAKDFRQIDLTTAWSLGRKFDLVLCLEVAEHLDEKFAENLIGSLTQHGDVILFSAASPSQPGQHHVNCQWPAYWQGLFNRRGYVCDDALRLELWDERAIEPWYRQNMLIAKLDPTAAGREPRLRAYVHPDNLPHLFYDQIKTHYPKFLDRVIEGHESVLFYLALPFRACLNKLGRFLRGRDRTGK